MHIPFCRNRCDYCDFNTYSGKDELIPAYVHALCREISLFANSTQEKVNIHSIYFGGGTPSILKISFIEEILECVRANFNLEQYTEISLEANPGFIDDEYARGLASLSINRLSIGMQSGNDEDLLVLGRIHNLKDLQKSFNAARKAGFNNINLDLIYGIPLQTQKSWQDSLTCACEYSPEHLSLYCLTLEEKTRLKKYLDQGIYPAIDADLAADMYEFAQDYLVGQGFMHYEISNWAKQANHRKVFYCLHNLQYWKNLPYIGFGAGAHGYVGDYRLANETDLARYIDLFEKGGDYMYPTTPATVASELIDRENEIHETMMLGLRLVEEGIQRNTFFNRFGVDLEQQFGQTIRELIEKGLLEWGGADKQILRLTRRGRILGNQVFMEFV
jgi:oxygen-independent coproporphyrinogen-3 oxidase